MYEIRANGAGKLILWDEFMTVFPSTYLNDSAEIDTGKLVQEIASFHCKAMKMSEALKKKDTEFRSQYISKHSKHFNLSRETILRFKNGFAYISELHDTKYVEKIQNSLIQCLEIMQFWMDFMIESQNVFSKSFSLNNFGETILIKFIHQCTSNWNFVTEIKAIQMICEVVEYSLKYDVDPRFLSQNLNQVARFFLDCGDFILQVNILESICIIESRRKKGKINANVGQRFCKELNPLNWKTLYESFRKINLGSVAQMRNWVVCFNRSLDSPKIISVKPMSVSFSSKFEGISADWIDFSRTHIIFNGIDQENPYLLRMNFTFNDDVKFKSCDSQLVIKNANVFDLISLESQNNLDICISTSEKDTIELKAFLSTHKILKFCDAEESISTSSKSMRKRISAPENSSQKQKANLTNTIPKPAKRRSFAETLKSISSFLSNDHEEQNAALKKKRASSADTFSLISKSFSQSLASQTVKENNKPKILNEQKQNHPKRQEEEEISKLLQDYIQMKENHRQLEHAAIQKLKRSLMH